MADVDTPLPVSNPLSSPDTPATASDDGSLALTSTTMAGENTMVSSTTQPDGTIVQVQLTPAGKRIKKIIRKKRRPARVQVDPAEMKSEPPPQTGTIFNIWYNKWSGGDRDDAAARNTPATTRCVLARDSGYTRADATPGAFFCMFFARGCCPKGADCEYLHRLPDQLFDVHSGQTDVFGRDKHADYRDDMGGVGSFMRQNRTLYVGRITPSDDVEEVVARHFNEWGPIERIRCLPGRGVAFVTYATEALAQFAKEAMSHQSLDGEEVLNVRWATVDPNPASQKREARAIEKQAAEAIKRVLPQDVVAEIMGDEGAKRRRVEDGNFGLQGYKATDEVWIKAAKERQLAAPEENKLLEGAPVEDLHAMGSAEDEGLDTHQPTGGLLGSSTLAALNGFDPASTKTRVDSQVAASSGPLVEYEDDEDEW